MGLSSKILGKHTLSTGGATVAVAGIAVWEGGLGSVDNAPH